MLNKIKKDNKGFTIIEVLIVLAIAGLILLVVFLAVPALQRGSRNNQRQSDATKVTAAITDCISNRNGVIAKCNSSALLTSNASLDTTKLAQLETITFQTGTFTAPTANDYKTLYFGYGVKCNSSGDGVEAPAGTSARQAAVLFRQENTSGGIVKCIDV